MRSRGQFSSVSELTNTLLINDQNSPPVVNWAALTLLYHSWPVLIVLGLGITALVVWRVCTRGLS